MSSPFDKLDDDSCRRLVASIRQGDGSAFERFYDLFFDACVTWTRNATKRDEDFCLDCCQDVMMIVADRLPRLETKKALAAWLHRCLHTKAIDRLRSEERLARRERSAARHEHDHASADPHEHAVRVEEVEWLTKKLGELEERDRALLHARFFEDASLAATGASVGIGGDAAHGRIRRLLVRLRNVGKTYVPSDEGE
ncbi:MAG: sigma-70 family RNA polymerase sigma factor [Planctomycetes bacterium]|nr:sigma-70 family RNA polymerase sigma factor [Planctomycetota bacterium]MCB9890334.1 sigma-70 family RNA polymerase sigma factor [Planctomycetota bacterium]MCB9918152.1 sigma-70 family RNA polymerase sigma factor [Planctomycetota bacterium]